MKFAPLLAGLLLVTGCQQGAERDQSADRAAIHALLVDYGATLDARDFDGFAELFAEGGVYVAGTGDGVNGAQAGAMMEQVFAENALGFREPNYHLFFNEVVNFDDADHASASSMSLYMVPDEAGRPSPAMMARYEDEIVRENGTWKFLRREVHSLLPAPPVAD